MFSDLDIFDELEAFDLELDTSALAGFRAQCADHVAVLARAGRDDAYGSLERSVRPRIDQHHLVAHLKTG